MEVQLRLCSGVLPVIERAARALSEDGMIGLPSRLDRWHLA